MLRYCHLFECYFVDLRRWSPLSSEWAFPVRIRGSTVPAAFSASLMIASCRPPAIATSRFATFAQATHRYRLTDFGLHRSVLNALLRQDLPAGIWSGATRRLPGSRLTTPQVQLQACSYSSLRSILKRSLDRQTTLTRKPASPARGMSTCAAPITMIHPPRCCSNHTSHLRGHHVESTHH